jgi:phage terminase large subunit-like protein
LAAPSLAERLALDPQAKAEFLAALTEDEARGLAYDWGFWARPKQIEPAGNWRFWLILAGRGFGKTRTGAQTTNARVERGQAARVALVAETAADARDVMVEGESGILASAPPWFRPKYEPSKRRLTWPNGAVATTYSADEPDQLRGPQHDFAWADELAKWRYPDAWDQLCFGLRLGDDPRAVVTTTPRPTPIVKALIADPLCVTVRGSTLENRANVARQWLADILRKYEGTRLGRQELDAEILDDAPGALWKREQIDADRVHAFPSLLRIVVAIDPSVSSDAEESETGIVVAGLGEDGHAYVLADGSLVRPTPEEWGASAIALYNTHQADRVVGEVNNGGDLVEANIRAVARDQSIAFKQVRASRGKQVRAEPIAALYEQHRVHHVGLLPILEDQLCQWEPGMSAWSPNRLDALVWALTELDLGGGIGGEVHTPDVDGSRWDSYSAGRGFG